MSGYIYETHNMDALLPFIFHKTILSGHGSDMSNWHRNLELIFCFAGEGNVKCNGNILHILPGEVAVVNSDIIHLCDTESSFSYYCLIIDSSFCQANGIHVEQMQFKPIIRDELVAKAFVRIAQTYEQYQQDKTLQHVLAIRCQVLEILCALYTHYLAGEMDAPNFANQERIKQTMSYIRQNLSNRFTLEMIATHIGISKFHLSREFKKTTGTTIIEFINLTRCTEAKRLIAEGTPVSSAAAACGYENVSYFTRAFKKYFGVLPSSLLQK